MNDACQIEIVKHLAEVWPDWDPVSGEKGVWYENLQPYDIGIVKRAASIYRATKQGGYKYPKLAELIGHIGMLAAKMSGSDKGVRLGFSLSCVIPPENSPKRSSHPRDIYVPVKYDIETVRRTGHENKQKWEKMYGGEWQLTFASEYAIVF